MKKRLHDKSAGIALLISLILVSVAEMIFRAVVVGKAVLSTSNLGEQIAVIIFASALLFMIAKGMDRACFLCYGAWIGYFVLDHIFELPGTIIIFLTDAFESSVPVLEGTIPFCKLVSMVGVIALGVILIEYLNDGTIFNGAFNIFSMISVCFIAISILGGLLLIVASSTINEIATDTGLDLVIKPAELALSVFNNVYRLIMVFMFTFFAYDSAKHQLKKSNLEND